MPSGSPATFRTTAQRKRVLEALASYGPMGWAKIASVIGEDVVPVRSLLCRMIEAVGTVRPVHIHRWERAHGPFSPWTPVFRIGDGIDERKPGRRKRPGRPTRRGDVVKALQELGPSTTQTIADYAGMEYSSVWEHLNDMHKLGTIHIHSWKRSTVTKGAMARRWMIGHGEDAPKPEKLTRAETSRRHYEKKRKEHGERPKGFNPWAGLAC